MANVISVSSRAGHHFSKTPKLSIRLIAGLGVEGDGHAGATVKHRSRLQRTPEQPNLRQVHLIQSELFDELGGAGFAVRPGDLGENITTKGIDLLALPAEARLRLGASVIVEITGLRTPCIQIDRFQKGLMAAVTDRDTTGRLVGKAGIMAIVVEGGDVSPDDAIEVQWPAEPFRPLQAI